MPGSRSTERRGGRRLFWGPPTATQRAITPPSAGEGLNDGEAGVLLFMSDSTNVEKEGYPLSEREIGYNLEEIFRKCTGRIIVASFSSNIHRIQQVIDSAAQFGRKVALNGKSMAANVRIAPAR